MRRLPNRSAESMLDADSTVLELGKSQKSAAISGSLFQPRTDWKENAKSGKYSADSKDWQGYLTSREKSKLRVLIGKIMFSKPMERFFFCLIVLFAGIVFVSVAVKDDLGDARIYVLSVELVILAIFLVELALKLCAVGWVHTI